ncbi:S8 family serine peptidase [Halorubrum sp. AS12]|uniref:S8 family serine peptidase n=1 Tax=Halorubrum sp. AS12 TaxID=3409687 RepID=UPI003DA7612C
MKSDTITTATEFRDHVFDSIFESVSLSPAPTDGDGIHIGIVDSVNQPPQWAYNEHHIYTTESFVDLDIKHFEIEHGMLIFDIIRRIAPKATFSFYQVVGEERENIGVSEYSHAIDRAIEDGVDLLNISLGAPNQIPAKSSPYYPPIERAVDSGILPIAAIGNLEYEDGPKQYVYGPANLPSVVSVGGCETLCPEPKKEANRKRRGGPYSFEDSSLDQVFCGQNECAGGGACIRNNFTRPYPDNTKPLDGDPEVLAPSYVPTISHTKAIEDIGVKYGTSFATPIVVGVIAKTLSETEASVNEIMDHVHEILASSGAQVDDYPAPKLDAFNFMTRIRRKVSEPIS